MTALFLTLAFIASGAFALALIIPFLKSGKGDAALSALVVDDGPEAGDGVRAGRRSGVHFLVVILVLLAPVLASVAYLNIGAPELLSEDANATANATGQPDAQALIAMSPEDRARAINEMVAGLAARLEAEPGDLDGWRALARAQSVLGAHDKAATSLERLFEQIDGGIDDWRNYAGTFIARAPEGVFPTDPAFLDALYEIERRAEGDIFARFYRGGAARESGQYEKAEVIWRSLRSDLSADDGLADVLDRLLAELPRLRGDDPAPAEPAGENPDAP